ncbi:MAG: L,D-transpeptidase [Cyanobacteria bacterium CRU_2_1]|nr:L,D-transpeptidase [Cyanobacteria bacterium RU_5_0]NJR63156.1 L,D-transpeptidase [Cyanobacteria bacterium CRU_2_1]
MEISLSRAITQEVRASSGHERGNLAIAAEPADVHLEINLEQREVSVYRGDVKIKSYPIGIGRAGWETPIGTFEVNQMRENPTWISPFTGERIPGGDPRNPLGNYWIGFWTDGYYSVGFHGTPDSGTIGNAESHGCIHMYDQDLEELYQQVNIGTPVTVIQ